MGQGRDGYSRAVAIFKVLLPLAALGILATLFLISRGSQMDAVIPFAEDELNERTTNQQITKPFFSGTTAQGDELVVTADIARPAVSGCPRPSFCSTGSSDAAPTGTSSGRTCRPTGPWTRPTCRDTERRSVSVRTPTRWTAPRRDSAPASANPRTW